MLLPIARVDQIPGVHNMLMVQASAAHMGGFSGSDFSKQRSLFRQIFLTNWWVFEKLVRNSKKWAVLRQKFIIKVGMMASFGN